MAAANETRVDAAEVTEPDGIFTLAVTNLTGPPE